MIYSGGFIGMSDPRLGRMARVVDRPLAAAFAAALLLLAAGSAVSATVAGAPPSAASGLGEGSEGLGPARLGMPSIVGDDAGEETPPLPMPGTPDGPAAVPFAPQDEPPAVPSIETVPEPVGPPSATPPDDDVPAADEPAAPDAAPDSPTPAPPADAAPSTDAPPAADTPADAVPPDAGSPDAASPDASPDGAAPGDMPADETPADDQPPPGQQRAAPLGPDAPPLPEIHYGEEGLPEAVKRTRRAILDAAATGDIEALRPVLEMNEVPPSLSTELAIGDPIDFLKSTSGDPDGREILAILADLLEAGWVLKDAGTPQEMYVWPYFAEIPIDRLTPPQMVGLYRILTAADVDEMRAYDAWLFFKIGIGPDGTWHYFLVPQ